jgi:hypothetical protein
VARAIRGIAQKDDARNSGQRPFQRLPGIVVWGVLAFFFFLTGSFFLATNVKKTSTKNKMHLKNKSSRHHFLFWGSMLWKCSCMFFCCFPVSVALKYL